MSDLSRMCRRGIRSFLTDERGQDLVEWTVGLPVFLILCAGIVFYAWMWWNQVAAAAAIHDGTYLAAIRGGDTGCLPCPIWALCRSTFKRRVSNAWSNSMAVRRRDGGEINEPIIQFINTCTARTPALAGGARECRCEPNRISKKTAFVW